MSDHRFEDPHFSKEWQQASDKADQKSHYVHSNVAAAIGIILGGGFVYLVSASLVLALGAAVIGAAVGAGIAHRINVNHTGDIKNIYRKIHRD
jgi:hypothetical protein